VVQIHYPPQARPSLDELKLSAKLNRMRIPSSVQPIPQSK
jgi:hypothetical protein